MLRRTARLHRIAGLALLAPLLAWTATGLLFLVKPGWGGAYELLDPFGDGALDPSELLPLAAIQEAQGATAVELRASALGPLFRIHRRDQVVLVHAQTGTVLSPLDGRAVEAIARDAASRSTAADRYGEVRSADLTASDGVVRFAGGAVVRVGRHDLALAQSGPDTAWIDRLYELHYLRWTGIEALDRALAIAAIGGTWMLAFAGVFLLRRKRASPQPALR
ncbi:hypothetical protein [Vulgatibacter incomptus]|uniref:PepSY domain-containing protein n=1 Tax=Vulgatibacter incomptus TaxID=1391653 RepID=A0A0K1PJE6_9BACT|nr:hypothetical protein [Vulgatibacter incomptus]AKU93204.1 hypothetical protein AKJ08_3591 [Vulgatibacter incomptus]